MKHYSHHRASWVLAIFMLFVASTTQTVFAAKTACPKQYLSGVAPDIQNSSLAEKTIELCYNNFAVMHSGITLTPLWSAEHLTKRSITNARKLNRRGTFHHELNLPESERAELNDYAHSGFDRGHMAPSGDMPTLKAQQQCFTLANMIPQNHNNNTEVWEQIESAVRDLAVSSGALYVITGPLYQGDNIQRLNGRVLVPTHIYKLVYDPKKKMGAAYFAKNEAGNDYQIVSISELEKQAGITFFPKLSDQVKQVKLELPKPTPHQN
jgi:endonuclease G